MSSIIYNAEGRPLLYVPDFFAGQATKVLKYVNAATTSNPELRKRICEREPLIFALVYLPHKLRSEETGMRYSLNPLHIYLAEDAATYWPFPLEPKEVRRAIVAPRDSGKTTWEFLILPCWAMCYGWRMFCAFFGDSAERAEEHLGNLRYELDNNGKLRSDFPELCTAARRNGRALGDSKQVYRSAGGHVIMARGIEARNLGLNEVGKRPDLIVIDDCEPIGRYSNESKVKREQIIMNGILPMNLNAAVYLVGTVVRYGSIMHEVVKHATGGGAADWIVEEKFTTKYWPAYYAIPGGGYESFWPEKWSMQFILNNYKTASFQLNWMNQPQVAGVGLWKMDDLNFGCPFMIASRVLVIDPAVKSKETNDETGLAVIGFDPGGKMAFVEYARGVRLDPVRLGELITLICRSFQGIEVAIIEDNNGGDYVVRELSAHIKPFGIPVKQVNERRPKPDRIRELHAQCQRRWVFISTEAQAFVDQALAYPDVKHDDVIDAVARGVEHKLKERRIPDYG